MKINGPRLPQLIGSLSHSNQFLKMFALACTGVTALALLSLIVSVARPPTVLTLTPSGERLLEAPTADPEREVREAISAYLNLRYAWGPENVAKQIAAAEAFVAGASLAAYRKAMAEVAKFSNEKLVTQHVYASRPIEVDLAKGSAVVVGDRVTSIQGFKAAADLKLELSFEGGPRTRANPWGVYISKEKEEQ